MVSDALITALFLHLWEEVPSFVVPSKGFFQVAQLTELFVLLPSFMLGCEELKLRLNLTSLTTLPKHLWSF